MKLPGPDEYRGERYSIAYFSNPRKSTVIQVTTCLPHGTNGTQLYVIPDATVSNLKSLSIAIIADRCCIAGTIEEIPCNDRRTGARVSSPSGTLCLPTFSTLAHAREHLRRICLEAQFWVEHCEIRLNAFCIQERLADSESGSHGCEPPVAGPEGMPTRQQWLRGTWEAMPHERLCRLPSRTSSAMLESARTLRYAPSRVDASFCECARKLLHCACYLEPCTAPCASRVEMLLAR